MKKRTTYLFTFILLLFYSLTVFRSYMPYLSYQVNYTYISTVLCENKTKPVLQCQGKCHLQKELKKTAQEDSNSSSKITIQLELEDMPVGSFKLSDTKSFFIRTLSYHLLEEKIVSSASEYISPPPQS